MSDVPQYPASQSAPSEAGNDSEMAPRSRRAVYVGTALVVLLVVLFVALHLTGVLGPAGH